MTRSMTRSRTSCEPRQATPRNTDRPTDGPAAAVAARLLGRVMPPWARAAVDVLGETDEDGHYCYGIGVVLVPRQSAKTTTALDVALGRGLVHRDYRAAYAAQTGHVTTERMGDRFTELAGSMLAPRVKVRLSAGTERWTHRPTGSYAKAFPPRAGSLRSSALDLVIVDEGQEHDDATLGVALDHAIMPTFTTRPRRQFLILGTAPDVAGTYLERYAQLARAGTPGVALIDYGATPDEDPGDPVTWHRRHPGLAAGLTDEAFLRSQFDLDPAGFAREHLNVWPDGVVTASRLDPVTWGRAYEEGAAPGDPVTFGLGVAVDGVASAIAAAGRWVDPDGVERIAVEIVEAGPGTSWVPGLWRQIRAATRGRLLVDSLSPAAPVVDALRLARLPVETLSTGEYLSACAALVDDVTERRLAHRGQPALDAAAAVAGSRNVGDRWVWDRRAGRGTELVEAVTVAVSGARRPRAVPSTSGWRG